MVVKSVCFLSPAGADSESELCLPPGHPEPAARIPRGTPGMNSCLCLMLRHFHSLNMFLCVLPNFSITLSVTFPSHLISH